MNIYYLTYRVNREARSFSKAELFYTQRITFRVSSFDQKETNFLDHPIEPTKEIAHTQGRWLINHFVVIITVLVYNFKLRAAYFILIILLYSPSRSAFVQGLEWKRTKEKEAERRAFLFSLFRGYHVYVQ